LKRTAAPRLASLGTRLLDARWPWALAFVVLAYDVATLARDLTAYDSPELALAAAQLGLSHPIGQPLHTLLGALFARMPFTTPLVGAALLSACAHALTAIPAMSLAEQLSPERATEGAQRPLACAAHATVIGAVLLTAPIWECATRVEVYTLSTFGVTWAAAHAASMAWERELSRGRALALGLALGLTASVNAYHAVLAAVALAPLAVRVLGARLEQPAEPTLEAVARAVLGGVLGLAPYLYVPAVGGRTDVVVWGAPTDVDSLAAYFRGDDYGRNRGTTLVEMLDHLGAWLAWAAGTPVLALLVLGGIAHVVLGRGRGLGREASAALSLGSVGLLCSHRVFHVDITDYQNYLAPALVVAGCGLAAAGSALAEKRPRLGGAAVAALAGLCLAAPPALWARTRGRDDALGTAARGALAEAPPGALVFVATDHWAAPLLYLQEVEHLRPDVVVVLEGLSSSSWYWALLRRRHPDLPSFDLAGSGGRVGRLRRLVEAAADRSVLVEEDALAAPLGLTPCDVGYLVLARGCSVRLDTAGATTSLAEAMRRIDRGSPSSDEALAAIAIARGEALWRLGRVREAVLALGAGVPPSLDAPSPTTEDLAALSEAAPLAGSFEWSEPCALGDARRAIELEGLALRAADRPSGQALLDHARGLGLSGPVVRSAGDATTGGGP
jgi:hypothetical protein